MSFFDSLLNQINPINVAKGFFDSIVTPPKEALGDIPRVVANTYHTGLGVAESIAGRPEAAAGNFQQGRNILQESNFFKTFLQPIDEGGAKGSAIDLAKGIGTSIAKGGIKYGAYLGAPLAGEAVSGVSAAKGIGSKIATGALEGAKAGGFFGAIQPIAEGDYKPGDIAKSAVTGATAGTILGGAAPAVVEGTKAAVKGYQTNPILSGETGHVQIVPGATVKNLTSDKITTPIEPTVSQVEEIKSSGIFNKVKDWPEQLKTNFADWVNNRGATELEAVKAKEPFQALDAEGTGAFTKIQAGDKTGLYSQLQDYFAGKYQQLQDVGIQLNKQRNYLPQLWQNSEAEVNQIFGKRVSQTPGFTIGKVIENYQKGIDAGLTPRFEKVSDLVGWYEQQANKSIADRQFLTGLKESGQLQDATSAPKGWKSINPDLLPGRTVKAAPPLADAINNYLSNGSFEALTKVSNAVARAKNVVLGFGIPKTGINAHGVNILARSVLSGSNPLSRLVTTGDWLVRPGQAAKYFNANLDRAVEFRKAGLTVSAEDHAYTRVAEEVSGNVVKKLGAKASDLQQKLFEDPLFGKILPATKLRYAADLANDLEKRGMGHDEALRAASKSANKTFGGINIEEVARSKDFQNFLRTFALAPDWLETQAQSGRDIVRSVSTQAKNPEFRGQRIFARNLIAGYLTANVINKVTSGHWMFQNDKGGQFQIDTGTQDSSGKERYLPIFGNAIDFVRVPVEAGISAAQGDLSGVLQPFRARLSTPASAAVSLLSNTDYKGNPIVGPDRYGKPQSLPTQGANLIGTIAGAATPTPIQSFTATLQGKSSPEQGITSSLELPVRYRKASSGSKGGSTRIRKGSSARIKKGGSRVRRSRRPSTGRTRTRRARVAKVT